MKVAIPEFMGMVSPRFDCCEKITLFSIDNSVLEEMRDYDIRNISTKEKMEFLGSLGVNIVICHGILKKDIWFLENNNIAVINLISGKIADVINSFTKGSLDEHRIIPRNCQCKRKRFMNRGR